MSRQILSYADLGPTTSVTTPIPVASSTQVRSPSRDAEPPRKRIRTNEEGTGTSIPSNGSNRDHTLPNNSQLVNGNGKTSRGNGRKGKKSQRPGNPSGIPWTRHWDAQLSLDTEERVTTLAYEDEAPASSAPEGGNMSHHDRVARQTGWKIMPPPSFIGPVVPTSEPSAVSTVEPEASTKKRKGKNSHDKELKKGTSVPIVEEEWDDSALIDAWNAAEEEYREMNGGKKWRCEPVKHSSLWHDEPYEEQAADTETSDDDDLQGSEIVTETIMEETYYTNVDHTDPALPSFSQGAEMPLPTLFGAPPVPVGTTRSALMEEAFRKAQEASYTAGYWTAIYQMHASQKDQPIAPGAKVGEHGLAGDATEKGLDEENEEEEDGALADSDFLPTQRQPVI